MDRPGEVFGGDGTGRRRRSPPPCRRSPVTSPAASSVWSRCPARPRRRTLAGVARRSAAGVWPSPTATTSTPVASGSSVPAWPTWRSPKRRRSMPTTSWLVTPAGLSTMARPCVRRPGFRRRHRPRTQSPVSGADSAARPGRSVAVAAQDLVDPFGRADHLVGPEVEDRGLLRPDLPGDRRLQPTRCSPSASRIAVVALLALERVEVHESPGSARGRRRCW